MKSIAEQIKKKSIASIDSSSSFNYIDPFSTEMKSPFTQKSKKEDITDVGYCECPDPICAICGKKIPRTSGRGGFKDFVFAGKKDV